MNEITIKAEDTQIITAGEAHCAIGPSTLPPRAVCPCHTSAAGGESAESGTRAHKVVEITITAAQWGATGDESAKARPLSPCYPEGTTDDEIGRGSWGARIIQLLRDETAAGAFIHTETRTRYNDASPDADEVRNALRGKFGTVDAFWESADGLTLFIADFKTYATSDGEKSYLPQGMMYAALLASERMPYIRATFFVVAAGDRTVGRYDFALDEAKREVAALIRRAEAVRGGVVFASGEEARAKCGTPSAWCKTCAYAATCPAMSRAVSIVADGGIMSKPLAVRLAIVPVLESFCKSTKAEAKTVLTAGGRIYDEKSGIEYAYAERKGRAKLADIRGLAEAAIEYGVAPDAFAAAVQISKTAVDGLLAAADKINKRKATKADREAVYAQYFAEPAMEKYLKRIA